jgi:hypothetical protein
MTRAESVAHLCDLVIKHTDAVRGKTPPKRHNHENGHLPTHHPDFYTKVMALRKQLDQRPLKPEACVREHEWLVAQILSEASTRHRLSSSAIPAYFEPTLVTCYEFRLRAFSKWFKAERKRSNFSDWNQLLKGAIRAIAHQKYGSLARRK